MQSDKRNVSMGPLVWVTNVHQGDLTSGRIQLTNAVTGKPQGTRAYSAGHLLEQGFVGIYRREGDDSFRLERIRVEKRQR